MARYEAPALTELGSLADITLDFNKVGHSKDMYSTITPLSGTIVTIS